MGDHGDKREENVDTYEYKLGNSDSVLTTSEENRKCECCKYYKWHKAVYLFILHYMHTGER